jgi:hypothetical protein
MNMQFNNSESETIMAQYKKEVQIYKKVMEHTIKGFPKFLANGTHTPEAKKFIVTSKHGFDLSILQKICGGKFTYKTALNIGIEMVKLLSFSFSHLSVYS